MNTVTTRTIPEHLLWDANYQFVINKPYALVFDPDKPLPDYLRDYDLCNHPPGEPLPEPPPGSLVPPELDQWFLYDSWGIEMACGLITLGYPVDLKREWELVKDWPLDCEGRDRFNTMCFVYDRAWSIADSSVKAGTIKAHDTPANWIKWAQSKGYSVAHLMPADAPAAKVETGAGTSPSGECWKAKARAIADKLAFERYQMGMREITARNISEAVATELGKDSTTHGIRGVRSAGSIRNSALNGWKFVSPTGTNGTSGTKK